ncbi:MAG: pantoate--beta-alanine ligase [Gammaproteobacteria bacterium]|nr:MAG: pantoate--beta-alanine ligase [Gammaproteobacteria bacterium]
METVTTIAAVRERVQDARRRDVPVGFVPTMGNLHPGHLALVDALRDRCGVLVASIFVNPLQFGPNEDLDAYPRTLEADQAALTARGVDILFAPLVAEIYPDGTSLQTRVSVPGLGDILCGASRPGHFDGVATVVSKLFQIVMPDLAAFGRKDFQQLTLIRRMVRDLSMPVTIVDVPTTRAADGLALSSRNNYLSADERAKAPALYHSIEQAALRVEAAEWPLEAITAEAIANLEATGFRPDYFAIRNRHSLAEASADDRELVILAAAWLGRTRLIDNRSVDRPDKDNA